MNPQSNPQRRARDLRSQDIIRLPEDIILGEIVEMHPLLTPKLTNATIERAVKDYIAGGTRKERVLTKYGEIGNWDVSRVTNMGGDKGLAEHLDFILRKNEEKIGFGSGITTESSEEVAFVSLQNWEDERSPDGVSLQCCNVVDSLHELFFFDKLRMKKSESE